MVFQRKTVLIFTIKNKNKTALAASFEIRHFNNMYKDAHLPRKFLVVVDGTPESRAALRWAERRAHGNGGQLALLVVLEPGGFEHWLGVETLMKEEAKENASSGTKEQTQIPARVKESWQYAIIGSTFGCFGPPRSWDS